MSGLILPGWLTQQPQYLAQIDWRHPLTRGLIFDLHLGRGLATEGTGRYGAISTTRPIIATNKGLGQSFTGTGYQIGSGLTGPKLGIKAAISFWSMQGPMGFDSTLIGFGNTQFDAAASIAFYGNQPIMFHNGGFTFIDSGYLSGGVQQIAGVIDGLGATVGYVNGNVSGTGTNSGDIGTTINAFGGSVNIGCDGSSTTSKAATGTIIHQRVWNRGLSAAEVRSLVENPWQIYKAPTRKLWVGGSSSPDVTVAASGQAITVSAGTLVPDHANALSGQSVSSAQGSASAANSVASSGQAITAAQGSVTPGADKALTGQAVTASQGDVAPSTSTELSGASVGVAAGDVSIAGDKEVAISGLSISVSQGTLIASIGNNVLGRDGLGGDDVPERIEVWETRKKKPEKKAKKQAVAEPIAEKMHEAVVEVRATPVTPELLDAIVGRKKTVAPMVDYDDEDEEEALLMLL